MKKIIISFVCYCTAINTFAQPLFPEGKIVIKVNKNVKVIACDTLLQAHKIKSVDSTLHCFETSDGWKEFGKIYGPTNFFWIINGKDTCKLSIGNISTANYYLNVKDKHLKCKQLNVTMPPTDYDRLGELPNGVSTVKFVASYNIKEPESFLDITALLKYPKNNIRLQEQVIYKPKRRKCALFRKKQ
jgi:hypothetical protein